MNDKRKAEEFDIRWAAEGMRRHADAALDGTHAVPNIPEEWAYALLGVAGWLETELQNLNGRTRPYAVSIARSFIHGAGAVVVEP